MTHSGLLCQRDLRELSLCVTQTCLAPPPFERSFLSYKPQESSSNTAVLCACVKDTLRTGPKACFTTSTLLLFPGPKAKPGCIAYPRNTPYGTNPEPRSANPCNNAATDPELHMFHCDPRSLSACIFHITQRLQDIQLEMQAQDIQPEMQAGSTRQERLSVINAIPSASRNGKVGIQSGSTRNTHTHSSAPLVSGQH